MFDKLEDLLRKFEEIMNELSEPSVAENQERFRALMKEQSDLTTGEFFLSGGLNLSKWLWK